MPRRPRLLLSSVVALLALALPASASAQAADVPAAGAACDEATLEEQAKILLFTKTTGFRHTSIDEGVAAVCELAGGERIAADATEDGGHFSDATLAQYDAVVFLSTTGDPLDGTQQAAFERYIQAGGGFAGVHAASDTEYDWAWYGGLVGAYFESHPANQTATIKVADRSHPSTSHLPQRWQRFDEWYNFRSNPRGDVHVLATLDESSYSGGSDGEDHPTAWCHTYDGGRSWYTGGGHTEQSYAEPQFRAHLLGGIRWAASLADGECGATIWRNFEQKTLAKGADETGEPIGMTVLPDGRVLHTARDGVIRLSDPDTGSTTVAANVPVYSHDEDGLQGIALDPDFETNRWVYAYYAPPLNTPPGDAPTNGQPADFEPYVGKNHLSRFRFDPAAGTIDLSSEQVLLEVPQDRGICCHNGGDIDWDAQGNLYLSTGDDTNPFESDNYTPIDERSTRNPAFDGQRTSANTNDLRGKILRIKPDQAAASYTIPSGNMFAPGAMGTRPEIYAMGFRNPFRISVDDETGVVYVGDYGPDSSVPSPTRGPAGWVEFTPVDRPGNYGWPYCVGANRAYNDYDFATGTSGPLFDCVGGPTNNSPRNTGMTQLPPAVPAWIEYHDDSHPELGCCSDSPMGGPVYRYDASNPSETKFPSYYDGSWFIYEWGRGWIKELKFDEGGGPLEISDFLPEMELTRPMDMEFGPDGALYVLDYGSGFFGGAPDSALYRIDYVLGTRAPIAVAEADPNAGLPPLEVRFSSAGSRDPDGGAITYAWDFDGDGTTDSTAANPTHTYTTAGNYTARLTVTDPDGKTGTSTIAVTVGNTRPQVEIEVPANGGFFEFGDRIPFRVRVTDPEDGTINCADVRVAYILGHDGHGHPLSNTTGCEGELPTSVAGGHGASDNIFAVINAAYTDKGAGPINALTGEDEVILQPKTKQAEFYTAAQGAQALDRATASGGRRVGMIEHGDWVSYEPVNFANVRSVAARVSSGGAGGNIELRLDAPNGLLVGTIPVANTGGWDTYAETDPVPITDPGGTHELFLVFTNPNAGTQPLLDVDVLRFEGKGVASTTRPTVAITSPADGAQVEEGAVTVTADAADEENAIRSVEFFVDGESVGSDAEAPYSATWNATAGRYTLTATATNARDLATTSRPVRVTVGDIDVKPPWKTFASTTADFFQFGADRFVIDSNGSDTWTGQDEYGAIYQDALAGERFDARVKLVSQEQADVWGKAGIMAKNDITGAGSSTGYAMMAATPGNGYAFQWDADGNGFLEGNVNTGSTTYPSWLRLQRDGTTYTGYYSADGENWTRVGSAEVAAPAAEQDLGMFSTSHSSGTQAESQFEGFDVDVPFVSASAEPSQGTAPLRVRFRANSTAPDATYSWDFGDGRPGSGLENPTHTYTRAGTYTATVTATRPNGDRSSSSVAVRVLPYCRERATPDPGYRMLFDNHPASLENWTMAGPGGFELQPDCTIKSFGGLGLLWYEEEFASPHTIKLDWKLAGDDNSGVFVGFPNPGSDPWVAVNEGYEIQIDATDDPDSTTGAIYNYQAPDAATRDRVLNPPGEWNTFEITVDDPRIVVRLNGEVINDFTSTDPARDLSSGYVGLQNHGEGDDVFFRNVQVRAGP